MSESARERILAAMVSNAPATLPLNRETITLLSPSWSQQEKVELLKKNLESVRSEVHLATQSNWTETLTAILKSKQIRSLLYASAVEIGQDVEHAVNGIERNRPELLEYGESSETFKNQLFTIDAAITTTRSAIAEKGALVLWPNRNEPRLMSLVPPIHIAILQASTIHGTFSEIIEGEKWAAGMPTNAVFISGPSKTADIELVLAFGVHGPKELVVIVIQ